jgi:putative endonuclease
MMIMTRKKQGKHGEELIANHLEKQGMKILARNYRKQFGEIDLIAGNKRLLVFVEVKLRTFDYVDLAELVVPAQQRRIIATAKAYLAEHGHIDKLCRFDVALVHAKEEEPRITYIPDAFQACEE